MPARILMSKRTFAVLILTHGRPDRVITYKTLRDSGYDGRIIVVIDNTDKTAGEYRKRYGKDVVTFNKPAAAKITDTMDNFKNMKAVVYGRNIAWDIAKDHGLTHFLVMDDDYGRIGYAFGKVASYLINGPVKTGKLNDLFMATLDYLDRSNADCIAWAQGGDFIGGNQNSFVKEGLKPHRKIMNTFFLKTEKRFDFMGTINEDTTAYVLHGMRGRLFLTFAGMRVGQAETQSNAGGLTDIYLQLGTYVKSFYTVIANPSCCKVRMMGAANRRLHHSVTWDNAVPQIVSESLRKKRIN